MTLYEEILFHLGGIHFMTSINAAHLYQGTSSLQFEFTGCPRYNFCRVSIEDTGLYEIEFSYFFEKHIHSAVNVSNTKIIKDILACDLRSVFIDITGIKV